MGKSRFSPAIFGKYLLLEKIGSGGMAEVFRAKTFGAAGFQRQYAIKKILPNLVDDEEFVSMFIDEAKVTVSLYHKNIVQVFDLGEIDGNYFIAMEFVHGKDLLDILAKCVRTGTKLPHELAIYVAMEMLAGLDFAHNAVDPYGEPLNIIHRDVSPSNIMLSYAGDVKVGDFGVAKSRIQSNMTEYGTHKGKIGYMSPEQILGLPLDRRADVFAAGIVLYEAVTMSRLFKGKNDLDIMLKIRDANIVHKIADNDKIPDELRPVLLKALSKEREDRHDTARDFYLELQEYAFENDIKVGAADVTNFVRDLFEAEYAEEVERRRNDPQTLEGFEPLARPSEPMYRYRDRNGLIFGPMSVKVLSDMLRSRPYDEEEVVSQDEGPWRPIIEFPELVNIERPSDDSVPRKGIIIRPRTQTNRRVLEELGVQAGLTAARDTGKSPNVSGASELVMIDQGRLASDLRSSLVEFALSGDAGRVPEIGEILSSRAGDGTLEGTLGRVTVPRLLVRLSQSGATGRLHVENEDWKKDIVFESGEPVIVASSKPEELFGNFLVTRGVIDAEMLSAIIDESRASGGRIGETLVRSGVLAPHDLYHFLSEQTRDKLIDTFSWIAGTWAWHELDEPTFQTVPLGIDLPQLIGHGAREELQSDFYRHYFGPVEETPLVPVKDEKSLESLKLSALELRVASSISPGMSVREVIDRSMSSQRMTEHLVLRTLFLLTEFEVWRFQGEMLVKLPGDPDRPKTRVRSTTSS